MAFSETCAVKFFPFIVRLVLCAVFLPMGWQKIFSTTEFSVADADRLLLMGVSSEGLDWQRIQSAGIGSKPMDASQSTASKSDAATAPAPVAPRTARSLYRVSLVADGAGFPYPAIAGWLVGLAELGGSVLLFVGAFSRLSALGIASVMAGAFWMTSWAAIKETGWWTIPEANQLQACAQVGLFLLAINIVLVGPGFLSVDGMMGGSPKKSSAGSANGTKSARKEQK